MAAEIVTNAHLVERELTGEWQTSTELMRKLRLDRGAVAGVLVKLFRAGVVERRGAGVTGEPYAYRFVQADNSPGGGVRRRLLGAWDEDFLK